MKIEEMFQHDFLKRNRISFKMTKLSTRTIAKKLLLVIAAGVMCIGSYHYGYESNQNAMKNVESKITAIQSSLNDIHRSKRDVDDSENILEHRLIQKQVTTETENVGGATYTRWGRRDCSRGTTGTSTVYEGIAAGSKYDHPGGGSNVLCADLNVSYTVGHYKDGFQSGSYIYGLEYNDIGTSSLFDFSDIESGDPFLYDVPCAVCLAHGRVSQLMIPGRETCPAGWKKEYTGYIFSSRHDLAHSTDYICIDDTPQIVPGTDGNQPGGYLYIVEGSCPSLQCGPYVDGREFRCVVCTL